jgi:hypothetical protein
MKSSWPVRVVVGFARFWWDFLVGDTPELFLATVAILAVVALVRLTGENALAVTVFPLLTITALGLSLWRARR